MKIGRFTKITSLETALLRETILRDNDTECLFGKGKFSDDYRG